MADFTDEDLVRALEAAGIGLWTYDVGAGSVRWSDTTYVVYQTTRAAFQGSATQYSALIHPDDVGPVGAAIQRAIETRDQHYRVQHRLAAHPDIWVEARGRVVVDADQKPIAMHGSATDVTSQRLAETTIRESEKRFRLFTELASDYVYEARYVNDVIAPEIVGGSFERTTGYTAAEVFENGGWTAVMHPDDIGRADAVIAKVMRGEHVVHEYRIVNKDGGFRWLRDRISPLLEPPNSTIVGFVGGVTDFTHEKDLADRLTHANKMEALARLAGGVAHDFNNLLTVLTGELQFIASDENLSPAAHESVEAMRTAHTRASELTRSLLAFGRRQVGNERVVALVKVIEGMRPIVGRSIKPGVKVHVDVSNAVDVNLIVDAGDLQLALLNLLVNANDAVTHTGSIEITADAVEFVPGDERPAELDVGEYARITVRDDGEGIPDHIRAHIFEPYFTTKTAGTGTGLGLSIVHGIVKKAGGALTVVGGDRAGTTIQILLPRTHAVVDTIAMPVLAMTPAGIERILLVEDDDGVRRVAVRVLKRLGYDVRVVESAEAALALGDGLDGIDLLVTDVRLPGQDGISLADTLRKRRAALKVLVMSGYLGDLTPVISDERRYVFLEKPFTPEGLARRVREALEESPPT